MQCQSKMGKAIHYALDQWEPLEVYLQDALIEILVENAIRPTALDPAAAGRVVFINAGQYANRLVLPRKPAAIVIYAGDNDLALGTAPETVFSSFRKLFAIFRGYSPSVPIAFVIGKTEPGQADILREHPEI